MTTEILLIASFALIVYAYALYPMLMRTFGNIRGRAWKTDDYARPSFSIILAVYNEELVLAKCLEALSSLQYPEGKVKILIGSDGSSDGTDQIAREYALKNPSIRYYSFQQRRGKIPTVNDLVSKASGEILFFTDADVTLDAASLRLHARHYADESIGGVAGNLLLSGDETIQSEPLGSEQYYMSVENRLRRDEARVHSTVGIFGGHYSIRRELWQQLPDKPICDELYIALNIIQSGKRMVFEAAASARERFERSMSDEFKRKARFAARGITTLLAFPRLLSIQGGWIAIMLWSHKFLRWFAPIAFALILVVTASAFLRGYTTPLIQLLALLEAIVIFSIVGGLILNVSKRPLPILSHLYWFALMNFAFGVGMLRFIFKREKRFWSQPTRLRIGVQSQPNLMAEETAHL